MAMPTDNEICEAIEMIMQPGMTDAVIWPYQALSHQINEWPALFRNSEGNIRGVIIKPDGFNAERKNASRDRVTRNFDIWFFYEFRTGKKGDNSSIEFDAMVQAGYDALKAEPRLGLGEVEKHDLLQLPRKTTIDCGESTLHFGPGRLTVHICC